MNIRRTIAAGAATALAATGLALLGPAAGSAQAASGCYPGVNGSGTAVYYCSNVAGAALHDATNNWNVWDHLRTTTSWFLCKIDNGPANGESSPHPNRWLLTKGDDNGNWGWVSDKDISSETDPVPSC